VTGSIYCEAQAETKETVENPGSNPIDDNKNKESVEESDCGVARDWLNIFGYYQ
jgi:hypothetical protein